MTPFHLSSLQIGLIAAIAACVTALTWARVVNRHADRDEAEFEQWELARRTPGEAYAACDDHAVWVHDLPMVPPHQCGPISRRRSERARLHRELVLMLCLAAVNRDDA